ncbi:H-NS histone family protein [Variovorax sp. KBS0712]|uniref:H-NS histone family protein n=1 Tax=Variovorax sp. KBS0712 TaxID=2578111 RepID=UPI00111B750C|nr:H-NS histone family protein [Variovorax sp. KBS0712]TSD57039.1 H-NS histone family protein [Variovorax sp. KBS0712]
MAKTFLQVQNQIAQLQREAEQLRKKEADGVLSRIKEAIAVYGFSAADLGFGKTDGRVSVPKNSVKNRAVKTKKSSELRAPKFRDEQGNTWSGRGPRPAWFKAALEGGKSTDELLAK